MQVKFFIKEIDDEYIRDNFLALTAALKQEAVLQGDFKFFSITVTGAVTNFKFLHKLGYIPKDVITLNVSNSATVTWKYDSFDSTNLVFTTSAACTIRAFIGRFREGELR